MLSLEKNRPTVVRIAQISVVFTAVVLFSYNNSAIGQQTGPDGYAVPPSSQFIANAANPVIPASPKAKGAGVEWQILQNPNGPHSIVLFDPIRQVLAVYQIDSATGAITLMSVRNASWDLQIESYNSNKPAPRDIRTMQPE